MSLATAVHTSDATQHIMPGDQLSRHMTPAAYTAVHGIIWDWLLPLMRTLSNSCSLSWRL